MPNQPIKYIANTQNWLANMKIDVVNSLENIIEERPMWKNIISTVIISRQQISLVKRLNDKEHNQYNEEPISQQQISLVKR